MLKKIKLKELANKSRVPEKLKIAGGNFCLVQRSLYRYSGKAVFCTYLIAILRRVFGRVTFYSKLPFAQ